jgi:hypothetical protein
MFTSALTGYCPACGAQADVHESQRNEPNGIRTTTRSTGHECQGLTDEKSRGEDIKLRTLLLSAQ